MIGNQSIINALILEHDDNPIKEPIGNVKRDVIISTITNELWKEWRKQLRYGECPTYRMDGMGMFALRLGKSKAYLRKLVSDMRRLKGKYPDKYLNTETRAGGFYAETVRKFRHTWKQVDNLKKEVNYKYELWEQKKILKYGDKAIIK